MAGGKRNESLTASTHLCKATEFYPLDLGRSLWMWIQNQTPPTCGSCLRSALLKIFTSLWFEDLSGWNVSPCLLWAGMPGKSHLTLAWIFNCLSSLKLIFINFKGYKDFYFLYRLIPNGWHNNKIMDRPDLMQHRPFRNIGRWKQKLKSIDRSPSCD